MIMENKNSHFDLESYLLTTEIESNLMRPFVGSDKPECAWLRWTISRNPKIIKPKSLLLLQDWGSGDESLIDSIKYITDAFVSPPKRDPTIANLLANEKWRHQIESGNMLVTNAVWGLRPKIKGSNAPMCGYLGAKIHKMSFCQWGVLVVKLCEAVPDLKLIVAGEWAKYENYTTDTLSAYLLKWRSWSTSNRGKIDLLKYPELSEEKLRNCNGTVHHVRHPAVWHYSEGTEMDVHFD